MSNDKKKSYAQYRHYHSLEDGYCDVYSDKCLPADKQVFTAVASSLQREGDSCFTYLPKGDRFYFIQTTKTTDSFAHGLALTAQDMEGVLPADYIGQLEKDVTGRESETLENGILPRTAAPAFSRASTLRPLFPRIVDALVYSDKPVVLTGSDPAALTLYVGLALHMLPPSFAAKIGFSVCTDSLPMFFGNAEHAIGSCLRLLATTARVGSSSRYTVINVDTATPEEDKNLRPYARAVDAIGGYLTTGGESRVRALINSVREAFLPDGSIRHELLETLLLVAEFERLQTPESARVLLGLVKNDKENRINSQSAIGATYILLDSGSLTAEDEALIEEIRAQSPAYSEAVGDRMGRFAFSKFAAGKELTARQRQDILTYLDAQDDGALAKEGSLLAPVFGGRRQPETFRLFCEAWVASGRDIFAILAAHYVHISDTYNYKELLKVNFDRALFEIADSFGENCADIYGLALLSCYLPSVMSSRAKRATTEGRIAELMYRLRSVKRDESPLYAPVRAADMPHGETVELVRAMLRVKGAVLVTANCLGEEICAADDFDFLPREQLNELVRSFSFEECLALYADPSTATDRYSGLQTELKSRLINLADVKTHILPGSDMLMLYRRFMQDNPDLFREGDETRAYVELLIRTGMLSRRVAGYRSDFVISSYNHLSASRRAKVAEGAEIRFGASYTVNEEQDEIREVLEDPQASLEEKQRLTETVIDVTRERGKTRSATGTGQNNRYLLYTYLVSLGYMLLAAIALLATPVATAVGLGLPVLNRVAASFGEGHIAAIVGVGLFNLAAYFVFWLTSKHDRVSSLRRAAWLSFRVLLLPILAYALGYALTYFLL